MAEFTHQAQRFFFRGISAGPADALQPGKVPYARNIRSYEEGVIQARFGMVSKISAPLASGAIHSLARLNDSTPWNGGVSAVRVLGSAGLVYRGDASGTSYASIDSGYSGNPLTFVSAQPPNSPRPYLYVSDQQRMRKFATTGAVYEVGLAQPGPATTEPAVQLDQIGTRYVVPSDIAAAPAGGSLSGGGGIATVPTTIARVATTISQIVFDDGAAPGYASVAPLSLAQITEGMVLTVGGEDVVVTQLTIAVASTTVAAIIYDSGTTGLCTIQPTGSLGVGQLEAPTLDAYRRRASIAVGTRVAVARGDSILVPQADSTAPQRRIRQVDFPVNSLVRLNGAETVRILSVALATDGTLSLRCRTATTIAAGHTIVGLAAFRAYLTAGHAPGQPITNSVKTNQLKYPLLPTSTSDTATNLTSLVGGVMGHAVANGALFSNGRAVLPDDVLHVAVQVNRVTEVTSIRLFFALTGDDFLANSFLENYFVYEWRASDIAAAIQATNAATVTPLATARATAVTNEQLNPQSLIGRGEQAILASLAQRATSPSTAHSRVNTTAASASDVASTSELALGNNQWMDLKARVGDLVRVGTDTTKTLANIQAIQVLVAASAIGRIGNTSIAPANLVVAYGDIYLAGGSGPDVGDVGDPIVYAYRYRSSLTGAVSNPSPHSRGGVIPKRQTVILTPTASADAQVDKIDWFRLGGSLTTYTYVGTGPNTATPFTDTVEDSAITGGETLAYDNFQPWPTQDLPATIVVSVAGTAIRRVSGDLFNTSWAAGSAAIINGRAVTLYASPSSTDLLFINETVPAGTGVACVVPGATKLSQPISSFWGDFQGVWFGCGDPDNPGSLYWTHGNNIEAARDADTLLVSPPSEPLMAGGVYNTFAFVFSSEDQYQILPNSGTGARFRAIKTPCGRGLWNKWAFCYAPEGIYFLTGDGIYLSAGGSPAVSVTDDDLRPIFPNDGTPGSSVNGIPAPNMTATTTLRLSYVAGYVYFDYFSLNGTFQTLIYDTGRKAWMLDSSSLTGIWTRLREPGQSVFDQILAAYNGKLYQYSASATSDDGTPIPWELYTQSHDGGQTRVTKQYGDAALSVNPQFSAVGVVVTPVANEDIPLPGLTVGDGDDGRGMYIIDLPDGGYVARTLALRLQGATLETDAASPLLYLWEPSFVFKSANVLTRGSDWDTLGYVGSKFVQGLVLTANTFGQDKIIIVQREGDDAAVTLTINHDGEETKAYPLAEQSAPGWPPFHALQVRILGGDNTEWQLLGYRFVWEPSPELATQWETQFTSHDLPGYLTVRDAVIAHESTCPIRFRVEYDDGFLSWTDDYTIPASGGTYNRDYLVLAARKGKAVKYQVRSTQPVRVYLKDCSIRVGAWGSQGGYLQTTPFGGISRASGAMI